MTWGRQLCSLKAIQIEMYIVKIPASSIARWMGYTSDIYSRDSWPGICVVELLTGTCESKDLQNSWVDFNGVVILNPGTHLQTRFFFCTWIQQILTSFSLLQTLQVPQESISQVRKWFFRKPWSSIERDIIINEQNSHTSLVIRVQSCVRLWSNKWDQIQESFSYSFKYWLQFGQNQVLKQMNGVLYSKSGKRN